jgi:hypothetical protein
MHLVSLLWTLGQASCYQAQARGAVEQEQGTLRVDHLGWADTRTADRFEAAGFQHLMRFRR